MVHRFHPRSGDLQCLQVGPLAPHLAGFAALLSRQGYCLVSGWGKVRLVAQLSKWMQRRRLAPNQLDEQRVSVFLKTCRRWIPPHAAGQATLARLLRHLRQSNAIPARPTPIPRDDLGLMEREYEDFLLRQRGLRPASAKAYLPVVRRFLAHRFPAGKVRPTALRAADVTDFVLHDSSHRGGQSAHLTAAALRSFLGFLVQQGRVQTNLVAAVPTVARSRLAVLPRFLEPAQVERVVRSCDRRKKIGKRDYAILLLLARLGLRGGEVLGLTLDDINWRAAELRIYGKGARVDRLPLPQDVGQALAAYLQNARPVSSSRRVFLQSRAPYEPLAGPCCIGDVVRTALARARIRSAHRGAHLFRHSLATTLLRTGASLAQIGQVLRHQQPETTEIYAKVDLQALRALAMPWPGGAS
ncbi:MAG TPA: integrase [Gammaproteobacteria bacterium]|nr:integrase [Gammaproteobacteria bacterium]